VKISTKSLTLRWFDHCFFQATIIVQVINYDISYNDDAVVDPLSAILSLPAMDKDDPRVESAIEEKLEDCLHD